MHVNEALCQLTQFFQRKGIENAGVDAEWLLAHVLHCKRLELFLNYDRPLAQEQVSTLRELAKMRGRRHPLQYLIGSVQFYGQEIIVDSHVLIPRPETEELIYQLNEYFSKATPPARIIDLGTGSGSIAITLATLFPNAQVVASDKHKDALDIAHKNAVENHVENRIQFIQSDWFENIHDTFDCIVSNPPYLSESEWNQAQAEVKIFEPKHALVANDEGLSDLKILLQQGQAHLNAGGLMVLETGINQHSFLHQFAEQCGYSHTQSSTDLSKRDRFFWAWL